MLVVGDVIDDILVRPLEPVTPGSDTRAQVRRAPGGSGANLAAWLGWLGSVGPEGPAGSVGSVGLPGSVGPRGSVGSVRPGVTFVGRVGAGDLERHARALRAYGVRPALAADPDRPTGTIVLLVGTDGERTMFVERGANPWLGPADLPHDLLEGTRLLHVSGYALFAEPARSAVLALAGEARRRGVPVSIDPGSAAFLREVGAERFLGWTRGALLAFPNADEAGVLTGLDEPEGAAAALCASYDVVVLTRGAEGAVVATRGADPVRCAADPVAALDSTGAGDAFAAGFLHAWLAGGGGHPGGVEAGAGEGHPDGAGAGGAELLGRAVTAARAGNRVAAQALGTLGARPPGVGEEP